MLLHLIGSFFKNRMPDARSALSLGSEDIVMKLHIDQVGSNWEGNKDDFIRMIKIWEDRA